MHKCAVDHGWWNDEDGMPSGPKDSQSAEAMFREKLGKPCGLASEFADTIIRILDTCEKLDIPVVRALVEKHHYNITRPYHHGGKLA